MLSLGAVSILGGSMGGFTIIFRIPPYFFRGRGKFYIEKEGKRRR
jgi:hypothetical protein